VSPADSTDEVVDLSPGSRLARGPRGCWCDGWSFARLHGIFRYLGSARAWQQHRDRACASDSGLRPGAHQSVAGRCEPQR
jgi:hypothetical protein